MRTRPSTLAVSLALIASAQVTFFAHPAFAQDGVPAADAKPAEAKPADAAPTNTPAATKPADTKAGEATDAPKTDAPPADTAPVSDGMVEVVVDSPVPVSLERRSGAGAEWEFACNAPCKERMAVTAQYRIVGANLNASNPFTLDTTQGDRVVLTVSPGVHKKAVRGVWILAGSGALVVTGVILLIAGSDGSATFNSDGVTHNANTNFIFAGTGLILAGVVGGVLGGAWYLDNRHSGVEGGQAATPEKTGPAKIELSTSKREPIYNAPKTAFGLPVVYGVPLLNARF